MVRIKIDPAELIEWKLRQTKEPRQGEKANHPN
jgi:hypothetical protein